MRTLRLLAVVVATFCLLACSPPTKREFGKADVEAINKLIQDFVAAYNAKDANKVVTLFSGGAVLMPPNASTVRGTESVKAYFTNRFAQGATALTIDAKDVSGADPIAYASGEYSLKLAPAGAPERRDRGKFLWILRDFNGHWLLDYLIFSSDFPAAGA
jgi:uncharacterized protein (TIGR02246 family)